jgi:hypothetical protein
MKTEIKIIIYALACVIALMIVGFIPMECHAQTIDMSFGHAFGIEGNIPMKNNIYETKIKISQDITYKWITVSPYFGWDTWFIKTGNSGNPFNETYSAGLKTTIFDTVYIDISHACRHQVESKYSYQKYHQERWDDTITMVTIGYHKKFSSIDL